uniref:Putative secreted protein n=1 Tax=Ixodes ricinus TaxID=34613 RepID=A0A6B0UBJ9_IXORI
MSSRAVPSSGAQGPALSFSLSLLAASASDPRRSNRQGDVSRAPAGWGARGGGRRCEGKQARWRSSEARNGALRLPVGQLGVLFPRP